MVYKRKELFIVPLTLNEPADEPAHIDTKNQNSEPTTSNFIPNDQIETIHQTSQLANVNHQLNSHIEPTTHKL